ncbi:MAG: glycosyltransferase family 1 protein [Vicinamibacterales bacterium]
MSPRPLTIAVDARELLGRPTGVGRYLSGLLREWASDATLPHRFRLIAPARPADAGELPAERFEWVIEPGTAAGTWWEQTRLPRGARGADVLFASGYTAPLRPPCPYVVAVYDVSFFAHPDWFSWREGPRRRWITRAAARRAAAVVTISEFSAGEIVRYLGVPRDRIVLAPPAAPSPSPSTVPPGAREPLVLYVGSIFARRRIPDLLRGFAMARARVPGARLVLVGDNRTSPPVDPMAEAAALGLRDDVEWRRYVTDAELASLYARARVFAFLSDYEGFAMTPAEALAAGVAPVLLDTPVAREVYADGARLVTADAGAIGAALAALLTDADACAAQVARGRDRLARYSWAASATAVRRALEAAARPAPGAATR